MALKELKSVKRFQYLYNVRILFLFSTASYLNKFLNQVLNYSILFCLKQKFTRASSLRNKLCLTIQL